MIRLKDKTRTLNEGVKLIQALDFSQIEKKMMLPHPEGVGYSRETVQDAVKWYKCFLELCLRFPEHSHVPNAPIDAVWHYHILDTRRYSKDCDRIFAKMLHHYPFFGLNGDEAERDKAFDQTNAYYRSLFGEDCTSMVVLCDDGCSLHGFKQDEMVAAGMHCITGCGNGCESVD